MAALGEIALLPKNIALNSDCSCGKPVSACPMWVPVVNAMSHTVGHDIFSDPYALNTGYPKASIIIDKAHQTSAYLMRRKFVHGLVYLRMRYGQDWLSALTGRYQAALDVRYQLYDAIMHQQGVTRAIDSSKFYLDALALYKHRPADMRIIVLSRDGRGVMNSNLKRGVGQNASVASWLTYYQRLLPLIEHNVEPRHVLRVKYEDLAQDTKAELERICEFVEVDYEPAMHEYASHVHHVVNANDMRFETSSEIRLDTGWQDNLTAADLSYFAHIGGSLNAELGYR